MKCLFLGLNGCGQMAAEGVILKLLQDGGLQSIFTLCLRSAPTLKVATLIASSCFNVREHCRSAPPVVQMASGPEVLHRKRSAQNEYFPMPIFPSFGASSGH